MDKVIVFLMGFQAVLLQMTLLRELLTVFSGNELDVGITLAVWLFSTGAGSFAGRSIKHPATLPLLFIGVMLLGLPTLSAVTLIRPAAGTGLGEVLSLPVTLGATVIILSPICVLIGMLYPQAVNWLGGRAALAYGLEAGGSFLGGTLFSFVFAGGVLPSTILSIVGILCGLSAILSIRIAKVGLYYQITAILIVIMVLLYPLKVKIDSKMVNSINSRYGRIDIVNIRNQKALFSSGRFLFSYPDPQVEEMTAHLPITLHPLPSRVLVVGGSPGVVREMLKYQDINIEHVEIDPEIQRISFGLLSDEDRTALRGDRLLLVNEDARRYVKRTGAGTYDLIVMNLREPVTANINRFYTVEFFQEARRTLKDGGVMVLSLTPSFGYVGRQLQLANGTIFASLRTVFTHVEPSSEEYGIIAVSDRTIETRPSRLRERFGLRKVYTDVFRAELLEEVFDPRRVEAVRSRLGSIETINRDSRPVAYLYNLLVWAEMQGARDPRSFIRIGKYAVLFLIALAAGAAALIWRRPAVISYAVFLTGGTTMAFSLAVILAFQAAFGYVYEAIGTLIAVFMAGMAAGAILLRDASPPLPVLRSVQGASLILFIMAPLLLVNEAAYYAVCFLIGATGGGEFAAATRAVSGGGSSATAGKLYALDLAGSFFGVLLCTVILVPIFGMFFALLVMIFLKVLSLAALLFLKHETA